MSIRGIVTCVVLLALEVNANAQPCNNGTTCTNIVQSGIGDALDATAPSGNGVTGNSTSFIGVHGTSSSYFAVYGASSTGTGVYGTSTAGNTTGNGVEGHSVLGYGVYGAVTGVAQGSGFLSGVYGTAPNANNTAGVIGQVNGTGTGVWGMAGTNGFGVFGTSGGSTGFGVYGYNSSTGNGVYGYNVTGGYAGYFHGDAYVTGALSVQTLTQRSDIRLKKDLKDLSYGLPELLSLHPVTYKWKDPNESGTQIGLVAQEVQKVIPEVVGIDTRSRMLTLNYSAFVPVLIKSIQEQQATIRRQEDRISSLERRQTPTMSSLFGGDISDPKTICMLGIALIAVIRNRRASK